MHFTRIISAPNLLNYTGGVGDSSRLAIVTGAGRGIGRAISISLARVGYTVALVARTEAELNTTAEECALAGSRARAYPADLCEPASINGCLQKIIEDWGRVDVLINNAGIFHWGSALEADPEAWDQLVAVNLSATMRITRLCLPHITRQEGGAVIFIASMAGKLSFPMNPAYVASKHGVVGFAESVFHDVRHFGTKVCAICPGLTNAGAAREIPLEEAKYHLLIQPQDIARAVEFVLAYPQNACPTEISISPQLDPWS